jgi:uncharacterized LabA/DUF88 family protein
MDHIINNKAYKGGNFNNNNMLPGNPNGLPDESFFSSETLVFIDEAFLSKLSKYFGKGKYLKFDRISFAKNISLAEHTICKGIFLYIAPPFQSPVPTLEEENKRNGYDRFIDNLRKKGVIIREGRCQRLKIDGNFEYRQKAVDVFLAMDLTNVPLAYPDVKKIILIASDSDFVPVIKNLEENSVKTILYTYYEKKRNSPFSRSNDLIKSVHKYVLMSKEDFENASLIKEGDKKYE